MKNNLKNVYNNMDEETIPTPEVEEVVEEETPAE